MKPEEAIEILELPKDPLKSGTHYHAIPSSKRISYADYLSARKVAIQALEKQIPKKPRTDDNRILCPECNLLIAYNKSIEQHCWTCGQNLEGCVIK